MTQDGYFMCFRNLEIMDALLASEYRLHWKCVCLVYSVSFLQWMLFFCLWCIFSSCFVPYSVSSVPHRREVFFYSQGRSVYICVYQLSVGESSTIPWQCLQFENIYLSVCVYINMYFATTVIYISKIYKNYFFKKYASLKIFCPC